MLRVRVIGIFRLTTVIRLQFIVKFLCIRSFNLCVILQVVSYCENIEASVQENVCVVVNV